MSGVVTVKARRVLFKDSCREIAGTAPDRWVLNSGVWTIVAGNMIQFNMPAGGPGVLVAPTERNQVTPIGLIKQRKRTLNDFTITFNAWQAGGYARYICWASVPIGAILGNSYVVELDGVNLNVYRSNANVLTLLGTTPLAPTQFLPYTFIFDFDPDTGAFDLIDSTGVYHVFGVDNSPLASGDYIGLGGHLGQYDFTPPIRVRRPDDAYVLDAHYFGLLTKGVSSFELQTAKDDDSGTTACEWEENDGLEVIIEDGVSEYLEFWGRVEEVKDAGDEGHITVSCLDWRAEMLHMEGVKAPGAALTVGQIIDLLVDTNCRTLRNGDLTATAEVAAARTLNGEDLYEILWKLAQEAGFSIWQTGDGKLLIGSAWTASGITIDDEDIIAYKQVKDGYDLAQTVKVYYAGGASASVGGAPGSGQTYGPNEKYLIDTSIPNVAQATARANYWFNIYGTPAIVIDVWCSVGHGLTPGMTGNITFGQMQLNNKNFLVLEKEWDIPDCVTGPGFRFRLALYGNVAPPERHLFGYIDKLGRMAKLAQWGLGQQI